MSEINHQQILQLRAQMELELDKLIPETDHKMQMLSKEPLVDITSEVLDHGDEVVSDSVLDFDHAMIGMYLQKIDDLNAALMRIKMAEYGLCKDCGEPISYERLQAYPTAKRCLPCQNQYERKHVL